MKKINKGTPYDVFDKFVKQNNPIKWEEIKHITYDMRLYMLCNEQDCLCGYSEIPLEAENTSSHIDHFVKQDINNKMIFDWNNLIVSTVDEDYGGKYKDNTYKISKSEYVQIFNPVIDDMSLFIDYYCDGTIVPSTGIDEKNYNKVDKTIKVFNLNYKPLKNRRKDILRNLNDCSDLLEDEIRIAFKDVGFTSLINWFLKRR